MRAGVCHLIHALSTARVPFTADQLKLLFKTLHENVRHTAVEIQEPAAKGQNNNHAPKANATRLEVKENNQK